jgi:hypothetical protein
MHASDSSGRPAASRSALYNLARAICRLVERWGEKTCKADRRYSAAKRLLARRATRCPRTRAEIYAVRAIQAVLLAGCAIAGLGLMRGIHQAEERIAKQKQIEEMRRVTPEIGPLPMPEADSQSHLAIHDSCDIARGDWR